MEWPKWLASNWLDIAQTIGVVFGLLATAYTLRAETKSRRVSNALALTQNHRELWSMMLKEPTLKRVLTEKGNLKGLPPTLEEELFVQMLILHVRTALKARETELEFADEDLATDVQRLFELPIPNAVWKKTKPLQSAALADLIEGSKGNGNVQR